MKINRNTRAALAVAVLVGVLVAIAALADVSAGSSPAPEAVSAPMRTVLLPPIPAAAPVAVSAPAAPSVPAQAPNGSPGTSGPSPAPTAAPSTAPTAPAAPGPQPYSPGTTIEVPQCVVTWTAVEQLPEPMPAPTVGPDAGVPGPSTMTVQDSYDGDCTNAQAVAADHPGSTVQQVTLPETTGSAS